MLGYLALLLAALIVSYLWLSVHQWPASKAELGTGAAAVFGNVLAVLVGCVLVVWPVIFAFWLVGLAFGVLLGRLP